MMRYAAAAAEVAAVHALTMQDARCFSRMPAGEVSAEDRATCRRNQAFTAQVSRKAVNALYEECGGSGLFESSDFQRLWRDVNGAAAHRGLTWDWNAAGWTKAMLGLPVAPGFPLSRP
jgi:3-hydroxy-9,10-secoandrosta-1,3,5(10)-triene-9,17-dione monooxygenase